MALSAIVLCIVIGAFAYHSANGRKPKLDQMRFGETDPRFADREGGGR